jgi:hypothetical protein
LQRNDNITISVDQSKMQVPAVLFDIYTGANMTSCDSVCPDYSAPVVLQLNGKASDAGNIMSKVHPLTLLGELMTYQFVEINPFVQYASLPCPRGGNSRCSLNISRDDCETKCRQDVIEKLCVCSADTVRIKII